MPKKKRTSICSNYARKKRKLHDTKISVPDKHKQNAGGSSSNDTFDENCDTEGVDEGQITEGQLFWHKCERCKADRFISDPKGLCCGMTHQIPLPIIDLPRVPEVLSDMYRTSKSIQQNSRAFNNLFAFTAMGVNPGKMSKHEHGPSNITLHGRTYHRMLNGDAETGPLRWFLYDSHVPLTDAGELKLDGAVVAKLKQVLSQVNQFWREFQNLHDQPRRNARLEIKMGTAREVAAIISSTSKAPNPRTIVCWKMGDGRQPTFINTYSGLYFPLQYPLLFPYGGTAWDSDFKKELGMTMLKYVRQLVLRHEPFKCLGGLFNEFLVDAFSVIEEEKLKWIKFNQKKICQKWDLDLANGEEKPGKFFLPASFLGGRRHKQENVRDSITIVQEHGRPTYFITATTNPNWPEIQSQLKDGQTACDRPDVVSRVFKGVLSRLLACLTTVLGGGSKIYQIHVIEFQKRGLPHAHIAVKFANEPLTPEEVDKVIWAERPENDPELLKIVETHMIHGHRKDRCYKRKHGQTTERLTCKYPHPITDDTYKDESGFWHYRRRKPGDENVVSYNPKLLRQFNCHINIDISYSVEIIIYLYKYMFKGPDTATATLKEGDEIEEYIHGRYLSASEASWRIFEYELTRREPGVSRFPVHLDKKNFIVYEEGNEERALQTFSGLEKYFARPMGEEFEDLTYLQYNRMYQVTTKKPKSVEAVQDKCLPKPNYVYKRSRDHLVRMDSKLPRQGEVWFLRLLLKQIAARSYEELKTVRGVCHDTFSSAAKAHGIYTTDLDVMILCMREQIENFQSPAQLRQLFFLLVSEGAPGPELLAEFKTDMIRDFMLNEQISQEEAENKLYSEFYEKFEAAGKEMKDFGLPMPLLQNDLLTRELLRHDKDRCSKENERGVKSLNEEQKTAYYHIIRLINDGKGGLVHVNGAAGTGKTFLINLVLNFARAKSKVALCCASTGIAALNYKGGRTAHNLFKIPIVEDQLDFQELDCDIPLHSERAKLFQATSLIVWDEFVMNHKENFHAVDKMLRRITGKDEIFGGICFISCGDFRQIPPVIQGGTETDTINASIKNSHLWKNFQQFNLKISVRQENDPEYAKFLNTVGDGSAPFNDEKKISLAVLEGTPLEDKAIKFLYPDLTAKGWLTKGKAFLCLTNDEVDRVNDKIYAQLPGEEYLLVSRDEQKNDSDNEIFSTTLNEEFCNSITRPNIPPHIVKVKIGMEVIILRNLSPEDGIMNNSKMKITHVSPNLVSGILLQTGAIVHLPRISFKISIPSHNFEMIRHAFPIRACYAQTINRAQGLTLDKCVLDIRFEVFAHGQLYVGLSRVRTRKDILLLTEEKNSEHLTLNVVYKPLID